MTKIRPIVKAAFKVDELLYQFYDIDIPDGYLETASIEEFSGRGKEPAFDSSRSTRLHF